MKNFGKTTDIKDIITVEYEADNAVLYSTSQSLTNTQKIQARANIGAGTSNFSGSYNDLTNRPTIPAAVSIVQSTGESTSSVMSQKATTDAVNSRLSKTDNTNIEVLGTKKATTTLGGNQLYAPNGVIFGGSAAAAGLVTRGICGVTTPSDGGACSKENLYINYDGNNDFNAGRQVVLSAGTVGNHLGSNMYQYTVPRGEIVKNWVEAKGYAKTTQIPTVNNGTLTIQKNGTTVQTFTANQSSSVTADITVPTKTSELTNDSGFLTSHQDISGKANLAGGNAWTGNQQFNQGGYWFATDANHPFIVELENGDELVKVNPNGVSFDSDGLGTMPFRLNGDAGTSGQVLMSSGSDVTPIWGDVSYDNLADKPTNLVTTDIEQSISGVKKFTNAQGLMTNAIENLNGNRVYDFDSTNNRFGSLANPTHIRGSEARPKYETDGESGSTVKKDIALVDDVPTSINGLGGGQLTSALYLAGGDKTSGAANIQLDTDGQITAKGTANTLFGRSSGNLLVGHSGHTLKLRGSGTRPTYNDKDMALTSDIPNVVQSTGTSETDVMSQKAVTTEFGKYVDKSTAQEITGKKTIATPADTDNSKQIANTEWVLRNYNNANICFRGVDSNAKYAGYYKIAEATLPNWYRLSSARIFVHDFDSAYNGVLNVNAGADGTTVNGVLTATTTAQVGFLEGTNLNGLKGRFFLVVRKQSSTERKPIKVELWYRQTGVYQRISATFLNDIGDSRGGLTASSKWVKFARTSVQEQDYYDANVVDLVNGFVPNGKFTTTDIALAGYPITEIYDDSTNQAQFVAGSLHVANSENARSDTPTTATRRHIFWTDKNNAQIASLSSVIGRDFNSVHLGLTNKSAVQNGLEFVFDDNINAWRFNPSTTTLVNLGTSSRKFGDGYLNNLIASNSITVNGKTVATTDQIPTIPPIPFDGNGLSTGTLGGTTNWLSQPTGMYFEKMAGSTFIAGILYASSTGDYGFTVPITAGNTIYFAQVRWAKKEVNVGLTLKTAYYPEIVLRNASGNTVTNSTYTSGTFSYKSLRYN